MNKESILSFIASLGKDTKTEKVFNSMRTNLDEIYKLEEKEFEDEKKRDKKEDKHKKDLERQKKRTEADKRANLKGPLSQILGNDSKKEGNKLNGALLGLLGLGAAGGLAAVFHKEIGAAIGSAVEWIKEEFKKAVDSALQKILKDIQKWAADAGKSVASAAQEAVTPIVKPIETNIAQPLQDVYAGGGLTPSGKNFDYNDVVHFANQHNDFGRDNPGVANSGGYKERSANFNKLQKEMRNHKVKNDKLYDSQQKLSKLKNAGASFVPKREIERFEKEIEKLKSEKATSQAEITKLWGKLQIADGDLISRQKKMGKRNEKGEWVKRQTGGSIENASVTPNLQPSGKEIDERTFSTTGYEDGLTTTVNNLHKTVKRYQTGGLVILQGHGDVPSNSGIAPGTDGPGTDYQGKYRPTAEQHFVDQVNKRTAQLAQKENVPISYQQSTGRYLSASHPKSNWSIANGIRRKGGSAIEMHFDAYGMQNGRMIEGARGILKGGQGGLTNIEKSIERKFGTHPSSSKGWGTLMLELDSLKYARQRLNDYPRMLVDAVKNAGAKGPAPGTTSSGTDSNPTVKPGGTNSGASPNTPTTGPAPNKPMTGGFGGFGNAIINAIPGVKAFASGFKSGFSKSMSAPPTPPKKYQTGGVVGMKPDKIKQRISEAHSNYLQGAGNRVARPVVVVKRAPAVIPPTANSGPSVSGGGGGLNMVEAANALHRIQSGAKF